MPKRSTPELPKAWAPTIGMSPAAADHAAQVYSIANAETAPPNLEGLRRSWLRSLNDHRVDVASSAPPHFLTPRELSETRAPLEELISHSRRAMNELHQITQQIGYVILLCDPRGMVVEHRGNEADAENFKRWGTWLGGVWSEEAEGTNGIGTCIAEQRPVTVHRTQHFRSRHVGLSCSCAPIFDADGKLAAALDVSSIDPAVSERSHGLAATLTASVARMIEEQWFRETFQRHWIVAAWPTAIGNALLFAVDGDQRLVGADRAARDMFSLDERRLLHGVSLWSFFERDPAPFRRADDADISVELRLYGDSVSFQARITPPRSRSIGQTASTQHARPRLLASGGAGQASLVEARGGGLPPRALRRVLEYVDSHLDRSISLQELSGLAGLSVHHFARAFKQSTGVTPHGYLLQKRITRAQDLLAGGNLSLSEIALAAGFADQSHLTRHFRQFVGETPGSFRRGRS